MAVYELAKTSLFAKIIKIPRDVAPLRSWKLRPSYGETFGAHAIHGFGAWFSSQQPILFLPLPLRSYWAYCFKQSKTHNV